MVPDPWSGVPDLTRYRTASHEEQCLAGHFEMFFEERGMVLIASLYVRDMLIQHNGPRAQQIRDFVLRSLDDQRDAPGWNPGAEFERLRPVLVE